MIATMRWKKISKTGWQLISHSDANGHHPEIHKTRSRDGKRICWRISDAFGYVMEFRTRQEAGEIAVRAIRNNQVFTPINDKVFE